jgi:predicted nucleotidyltransferase
MPRIRNKGTTVTSAALRDLIARVTAVVRPLRIVLFGSAVRGRLGPNSDLDILVVAPDGTRRRETAQAIYQRLIGFAWPVDVVVATEQDLREHASNFSLVYYPALRQGKVIYGT